MSEGARGDSRLAMLEALYDAYHRQALGLAYHLLQDQGDAEEVVQDAFLAAWRNADSYDPAKGSTRTWILTFVRNRAIDRLRARRSGVATALDEQQPDERDLFDEVAKNIEAARARRALQELPQEQRQVIGLAYFAGLTQNEIAERLAIPAGTVKSRIRLGLNRLRVDLGPSQGSPASA